MPESNIKPSATPSPEHLRLNAFVGAWSTQGEIRATADGPAARMQAADTYEWLPGGFFLAHRWDARLPDRRTQGIEIIGYDGAKGTYPMHSFDSLGNTAVMHASVNGRYWSFTGESLRFTGGFSEDGNTFAGLWEQRSSDRSSWLPWMDITLMRTEQLP